MAKKKKNKKIVHYRKPLNLNVGMIIFAIIFIYLSFSVYTYIRRDKIQFYEVVEGGIVNDSTFTGIILREEIVKNAPVSGYVNYYVREGKRASVGSRIYSIDESGQMTAFLESRQGDEVEISAENLSELKKQLSSTVSNYDDTSFSSIYDAKVTLNAAMMEYTNLDSLSSLDSEMEQMGIHFRQVTTDQAGVVSYAIDSYESLKPEQITAEHFNKAGYERSMGNSGKLVENGSPVYKIIPDDRWTVVFQLSEEQAASYSGQESLNVNFNNGELETSGTYTQFTGADGGLYGRLDFDRYMVQFVSDRFVNFEILSEREMGLKIPISAVTTKNFYTVPVDFLTEGGNDSGKGFIKEVYSESGEASAVFTPTTIYNSTDEYYYIDTSENSEFKSGDYILKPDSNERYQVGPVATLEGAYNINKGYAVFKQIEVLSTNGEYYTVKKNMDYGLSVYDHIVLDADTVTEGQIIY